MTTYIFPKQSKLDPVNSWQVFSDWITSTNNRLYIGWFGILAIPTLLVAAIVFVLAIANAPSVDMEGIRAPIAGSLMAHN
ncbi:MAG: Photosystem Q(B) protein 1, partial [Pseudanabaena sp.]